MSDASAMAAQGLARLRERAQRQLLLDANADTPVRPAVLATYLESCSVIADSAASHAAAVEARELVAQARRRIGEVLGCAPEAIWPCSGGTEADALALGTLVASRPSRLVVSSIEHAAVARTAAVLSSEADIACERLAVGRSGRVDVVDVERAAARGVAFSVIAASNETGAVQPIAAIAEVIHAAGGSLHSDAVQLPGRAACDVRALGADMVTFSSHKVGAPGGVGIVVARAGLVRDAAWQTPPVDVAGIVALAHALELLPDAAERRAIAMSRDALEVQLCAVSPGASVVAGAGERLCNTTCICFSGCEGEAILMALDVRDIAVSTGSACHSGSIDASPILLGMGLTPREANSTIRLSLARPLDAATLERTVATIREVVTAARSTA